MNEIDWENPFKPQDFEDIVIKLTGMDMPPGYVKNDTIVPIGLIEKELEDIAKRANARFRELLKKCPEVSFTLQDGFNAFSFHNMSVMDTFKFNGKRCRIIAIEEIK